jgi:hypothetical protein
VQWGLLCSAVLWQVVWAQEELALVPEWVLDAGLLVASEAVLEEKHL